MRAISKEVHMNLIHNMYLEITLLKLIHLPGAKKLIEQSTHCGLVTSNDASKLCHHWFRSCPVPSPVISWTNADFIANQTIMNRFLYNFDQNTDKIFSSKKGIWLIHWGWVMHICISKLNIIGSDNGLSPGRRQVIIWTNAGILLIGPLGTNFNEIFIEIHTFPFKKIHLKISSAKRQPFVSSSMC